MCSAGVALRNSSNIVRSAAMSSSDACSVASRAAMLSSAAHISIISMICFFVLRTMKPPRRGTVRRKPSCSSSVIASRIGVRETPSAEAQLALVEADLLVVRIDVGIHDRLLQRGVGLVAEARVGRDRLQRQRRRRGRVGKRRHAFYSS